MNLLYKYCVKLLLVLFCIVFYGVQGLHAQKQNPNIIAKLDELGLRENTLILFTGDNGTDEPIVSLLNGKEIPGGKGTTTDNGTHVPLISNWNGKIKQGQVCDDLIDFSDFLPTLCDVADIKLSKDKTIDGVSFMPKLYGKKGTPREWIYCWYSRNGSPEKARILARNHRYILYATGEFYEISKNPMENNPLDLNSLAKKTRDIHEQLNDVLKKYQNELNTK